MNKTEIYNQYAIEQGYESWEDLYIQSDRVFTHFNNVTDLIQEELLKIVAERTVNKFLERHINWEELEKEILNTQTL